MKKAIIEFLLFISVCILLPFYLIRSWVYWVDTEIAIRMER